MSAPGGRRQSSRAIRSTASRPQNYYARTFSNPVEVATPSDAQPGFFPALTHFTDAVDALPREIMRHFSMMKEVDAKLYGPEEELSRLAEQMVKLPRTTAPNGLLANGNSTSSYSEADTNVSTDVQAGELSESDRFPLYRRLNYAIAVMGPVLDEKIAVLSTANIELEKQLERLQSSYIHIPEEISDEARLGSTTHWAYVTEKEPKKTGNERTRREVAAATNYAGASHHDLDVAAGRSEARREAMLARKNRNHQQDSDFEERVVPRKPKGKSAKHGEASSSMDPGLGITNGTGQGKRKKPAPGAPAPPMERSISGALGGQRRPQGSPTPGAEGSRKRKNAAAPGPVPGKKRLQVADGKSPRPFSSPLVGTFNVKETVQRPGHTRNKHGSQSSAIQNAVDPSKARPSSSVVAAQVNGPPAGTETTLAVSTASEAPTTVAAVAVEPTVTDGKAQAEVPAVMKREEAEVPENTAAAEPEPVSSTIVTTRTGRVSKTSTPVVGTFPEATTTTTTARAGSRTARTKETAASNGSHASSESGYGERSTVREKRKRVATRKAENGDDGDGEEVEDEEEEPDGDEPRYCYCNEVSYGEMVACDNATCVKQWFHLRCAGLKEAPTTAKWYCEDCKTAMRESRRVRPNSRRE